MKLVKQRSDKTWVHDRDALAVYVRKLKNKTGERSELSMIAGACLDSEGVGKFLRNHHWTLLT